MNPVSVDAERVIIHLTTQIAQLSRELAIAQAQLDTLRAGQDAQSPADPA